MAKISGSMPSTAPTQSPGKIGAPSNVNRDKTPVLHAPRIRALNTRNYGKGAPNPYPDPADNTYGAGVGFGPKDQ